MQRLDQLREKGASTEFIHDLAHDAQTWANLRNILQGQVQIANNFAAEYCHDYNEDKGLNGVQKAIDGFSDSVNREISQLDQTVRDLLQIVSMLAIVLNNHPILSRIGVCLDLEEDRRNGPH